MEVLAASVTPPRRADPTRVRERLDELTKPPGSLGRLEELALRIAMIHGDPPPVLGPGTVFVLAGDHGVAREGVSAYPPEVTGQMCRVLEAGEAAVQAVAGAVSARVVAADLGVAAPLPEGGVVRHRKVRSGSRNLRTEAALTREEVRKAVAAGAELAEAEGARSGMLALGEIGIGNTTAAAAITSALTGAPPEEVVGPGSGLGPEAVSRKRAVVTEAVERVGPSADPLEVLGQLGGLEIAGLVGVALGGAKAGKAVVTDGVIATAAALTAVRVCPPVREYLFASHRSPEPAHGHLLEALNLSPLFELGMRLGEGTGSALAFPFLEASSAILREMATFEEGGVAKGPMARKPGASP